MDRPLTAFALAGLLAVSVLAAGVATTGAQTQAAGNQSATITATGTGEVTAQPDTALVSVSVTATGDTSGNATDRLAGNASRLRGALGDDGTANATDVESLVTTGYGVSEARDNGTTTYRARQTFELTVANTSAAGDVIDAAVANGATAVDGVTFTLSTDERRDLRADAIDRAVTDARSQAGATADSADLALGPVRSITVSEGGVGPVARSVEADAGTVIDPAPVSVSVSATVTYDATGA